MKLEAIKLGNITVTPIFEIEAGEVTQEGIPDATPEAVQQIAWLRPHYAGITRIAPLQTFREYRTHQDALLF